MDLIAEFSLKNLIKKLLGQEAGLSGKGILGAMDRKRKTNPYILVPLSYSNLLFTLIATKCKFTCPTQRGQTNQNAQV